MHFVQWRSQDGRTIQSPYLHVVQRVHKTKNRLGTYVTVKNLKILKELRRSFLNMMNISGHVSTVLLMSY